MAENTIPVKSEAKKPMETREESRYLVPPVDIYETKEGLNILCDLPGVAKEGLDVRVDNNVLTIKGKVDHKTPADPVYTEFELLNYYRQFQIGEELNTEKINANMKNGVLNIFMPKMEKAKPKKIEVKVV